MLKNVLIGTDVAYTTAANPSLLSAGQIGVYSLAADGTYTRISSAISAAQSLLPIVIAQGPTSGRNVKMFTIYPKSKLAYSTATYVAPIPNVFIAGFDGVTTTYDLVSGVAGTYNFKIQNLSVGNPPFPTYGSTPYFQTAGSATSNAIAEAIVKDINAQVLNAQTAVMPEQRFAFTSVLSNATTAQLVTSAPANVTVTTVNGSDTITLSASTAGGSTEVVAGSYLRIGHATTKTVPIYKVKAVLSTTSIQLETPYLNAQQSLGAITSSVAAGWVIGATVTAAVAGIRVVEFGNRFNGSTVLEAQPNTVMNVTCSSNLSGTPVINNQTVARPYLMPNGAISGYVSAAGATSSASVVTVGSTTNLLPGMVVSVTAGTGAFVAGTKVSIITSATTFTVDTAPSVALSGGASVVTGVVSPYTEGVGTAPQIFKKELWAAGYSGFGNRSFLPDNFPIYTVASSNYNTIGLQFKNTPNDYTATGVTAGDTQEAILAIATGTNQYADLVTILSSTNW